jgi:hypothetical protein
MVIILDSLNPSSPTFKSELTSYGHGKFQTATIKKTIKLSSSDFAMVTLFENEECCVSTFLDIYNHWKEKLPKDKPVYIHSKASETSNDNACITNPSFFRIVIINGQISVYDKKEKKYATEIDYYKLIDHPAPAIGDVTDVYAYKGYELIKFTSVVF